MKEKVSEIVRNLRWSINSGVWGPSEKIPSENGIAIKMNCSRMTARKALIILKEEGYLTSRKGRGYYVSMGHEKLSFKARGEKSAGSYQFHVVNMGLDKRSKKTFKHMNFDADENKFNFVFMKTQFNSMKKPFTVLHSFVNKKLLPNASASEIKESFSAFLAKHNVKVVKRIEKVVIIEPPQSISIKLNINQHSKVVASHSLMFNDRNEIIEYAVRYTLLDDFSETFEIDY